ncbi:MAG TPA: hypothetical protein PKU94_08175 [Candidatus Hydrothermia bacterium]|nr:hypothetical protein [Candidatus Hydrothermia bacterium]
MRLSICFLIVACLIILLPHYVYVLSVMYQTGKLKAIKEVLEKDLKEIVRKELEEANSDGKEKD